MDLTPHKKKFSFHIPIDLYERMREHCFAEPRSGAKYVSINGFVIRALEAELRKNARRAR